MHLTVQLRLLPNAAQKKLLLETMKRFNSAASHAAVAGFAARRFSQPSIHAICYRELRAKFGLSSQMAVRAIGKAVECFQMDKSKCPVFKSLGAMTYDERMMSFKGIDRVSLLTLGGRQKIPMVYGEYQRQRFGRIKGQCDLVYREGKFFLMADIDLPEKPPVEVKEFLGVDLGISNLITTSDGHHVSGSDVESARVNYLLLRQFIQRKMNRREKRRTRKNARRAYKRIGCKERRFRNHTNHCISKALVALAKGTERGIALEDLSGIRDRTRFRKEQRARMGGWSFLQLRKFITYKSKIHGIPVVTVDPKNTSRTCSKCGHCEKRNRKSQSEFVCRACGHSANADHNAAINIAARASISVPQVSQRQHVA